MPVHIQWLAAGLCRLKEDFTVNRFVGFVVLSVLSVTFSVTASAVLVPLGTAQGGIGAYFNSGTGLGENPANMAYWEAQTALGATNGMYFQFDTTVLPILGRASTTFFPASRRVRASSGSTCWALP